VLAAEKSKVPFYIAGGLLVLWALTVSMGIGMRRPNFPETLGQQRLVMGISIVLVLAAVSMAVVTSGGDTKSAAAATPATSTSSTQPTATTGTPAPASSPAAEATTQLSLAANPEGQLKYNVSTLTAKAGTVTISFENASPVEHNVTVAEGSTVLGATPTFAGGSRKLTLKLKAGTYTFYCSVPGHRQAGMEGKLTVTS
jgi:plastocyanin